MSQETTTSSTRHEPLSSDAFTPPTRATDTPADGEVIQPTSFAPLNNPQTFKQTRWQKHYSLLAIALVALGSIAAFLFAAQTVTVSTTPSDPESGVSVSIDRLLSFKIGKNFLLLPGDAVITANAPGYLSKQQHVTITKSEDQIISLELAKLPGSLRINPISNTNTTQPISGDVLIDGERVGALGETISDISAGPHQLQVASERYLPVTAQIDVIGMEQFQEIPINLEPAWANVNFTSEPTGAAIIADGELLGTTPATVEILAGEREIQLSLDGYKPWDDLVELQAGDDLSIERITLEKADGLVSISSQPSGASITVSGKYYGLTPQDISLNPGQSHTVTLFKEGYQPINHSVNVASDKTAKVTISLIPNLGEINIAATPNDALLYVDGRLMGRANQTLTLPSVQTQIKIEKEGYAAHTTSVTPRANFAQTLDIRLKTIEEARWENIPRTIKTETGQILKLFNPDVSFTMGSSRREQGRRANEGFRSVVLSRPFYLATHEATNRDYRQFKVEHSSNHVKGNSLNGDQYPVVNISWQDAALFCNWLSEKEDLPPFYRVEKGEVTGFNAQSNGYRLPSEAEWAWAARFEENSMLKYAWGNQLIPNDKVANIGDRSAAPVSGYVLTEYDDGYVATAPVGSFPANKIGLYDLSGNVAEWVHDFYEVSAGLSLKEQTDPLGPESGGYHVIRGPSWAYGTITMLRLSYRDYGAEGRNDVGFRVARYVD